MPQDHRLQQQRFELKYLVKESLTPAMRDYVASYLELDDYGVGQPNLAYPVHSLYLDSADLHTHREFLNGTKNRFKLRLRYYDDRPGSPVFFEVKGRVDSCILKRRCGVRRDAVAEVLNGQWPEPDQFVTNEPRHLAALERFQVLMNHINAAPRAHNTYWREAWVSPNDNSVRVTFDRNVRIEPHFNFDAVVFMRNPSQVYADSVILELKFTDRFPTWFNELVERFNLMQLSAAKYSGGILMLGEACFDERYSLDVPFLSALPGRDAGDLILAEI